MKLSVIVCTRNRAYALTDCLQSIAESVTVAACKDAEIVLVDNASTDDTSLVVTRWAASSPVPVKQVYEGKQGLSAARNAGIREAVGELVVFTDDDCRLSLPYISELLRYDAQDNELVMRSGSVILGDPTDLPLTVKSVTTAQRWKKPMDIEGEGSLMSSLIGCNMTLRRASIDRLGLFDERLGAGTRCPAGEDTDYFYRAYLAGMLLEMVPDMVVTHYHGRKQIAERTKLLKNYAVGNGALSAKYVLRYPNFSRHFVWAMKDWIATLFSTAARARAAGAWLHPADNLRCMVQGAWRYFFGGQ